MVAPSKPRLLATQDSARELRAFEQAMNQYKACSDPTRPSNKTADDKPRRADTTSAAKPSAVACHPLALQTPEAHARAAAKVHARHQVAQLARLRATVRRSGKRIAKLLQQHKDQTAAGQQATEWLQARLQHQHELLQLQVAAAKEAEHNAAAMSPWLDEAQAEAKELRAAIRYVERQLRLANQQLLAEQQRHKQLEQEKRVVLQDNAALRRQVASERQQRLAAEEQVKELMAALAARQAAPATVTVATTTNQTDDNKGADSTPVLQVEATDDQETEAGAVEEQRPVEALEVTTETPLLHHNNPILQQQEQLLGQVEEQPQREQDEPALQVVPEQAAAQVTPVAPSPAPMTIAIIMATAMQQNDAAEDTPVAAAAAAAAAAPVVAAPLPPGCHVPVTAEEAAASRWNREMMSKLAQANRLMRAEGLRF